MHREVLSEPSVIYYGMLPAFKPRRVVYTNVLNPNSSSSNIGATLVAGTAAAEVLVAATRGDTLEGISVARAKEDLAAWAAADAFLAAD